MPESPDDYREAVRATAARLGFIAATGKLRALDSLSIVNLSIALEEATGIKVPVARAIPREFKTLETIASLLADLKRGG